MGPKKSLLPPISLEFFVGIPVAFDVSGNRTPAMLSFVVYEKKNMKIILFRQYLLHSYLALLDSLKDSFDSWLIF